MMSTRAADIIDALIRPDALILARDAREIGCYDELRRLADAGALVRVRRGAFVSAASWHCMTDDERYLARICAASVLSETPLVFSHWSAAALRKLPIAGSWPLEVHCLRPARAGGRARTDVVTHAGLETARYSSVDGILATECADTIVALAATASFPTAVAFADAALRPVRGVPKMTANELHDAVAAMHGRAGVRAAAEVAAFADERSESVGESVSRANMLLAGIAIPELQVWFSDADGHIGRTDFYWRGHRLIGEFDGVAKYVREEFTSGADAGSIVVAEKWREDRLRSLGEGVVRWGWREATSAVRLRSVLRSAGAPERLAPAFPTL